MAQSTDPICQPTRKVSQNVISTELFGSSHLPTSITLTPEELSFSPPMSLTPRLLELGVPSETANRLSQIYLSKSQQLMTVSEAHARASLSKLASFPRPNDDIPLLVLQRQVFEAQRQFYHSTLSKWAEEMIMLLPGRLAHRSTGSSRPSLEHSKTSQKKSRRGFKSEYLPLFEFAFDKDRFPSREDKKHLARISGMSYRQVNVWFQNRRCRQPSRAKSHRITSAPPKTFEEMKACLDPSARAALLESTSFTKKLNPDHADLPDMGAPVLMGSSLHSTRVREVIVLDEDVTSAASTRDMLSNAKKITTTSKSTIHDLLQEAVVTLGSTTCAVSLGASDPSFAPDECEGSGDKDFLTLSTPQCFEERPSPPQKHHNPLNPFGTSVHAFPTPYAPSTLTSNPFIVEHHPWLRDPRTCSKSFIDPTPEAITEILDSFDHMDVDDPVATVSAPGGQLDIYSQQRVVSTESLVTWSSRESTLASRASSYSSSVRSSPRFSEAELASPTGCVALTSAKYMPSPVAEKSFLPDFDTETTTGSPAQVNETAGPSAASLDNAASLEPLFLENNPSIADANWQALLTATS